MDNPNSDLFQELETVRSRLEAWCGNKRSDQSALREVLNELTTLLEQEKHYQSLIERLPQLVWTCLPHGECDYLSERWAEYSGVPCKRLLGFGWLQTVHADDQE